MPEYPIHTQGSHRSISKRRFHVTLHVLSLAAPWGTLMLSNRETCFNSSIQFAGASASRIVPHDLQAAFREDKERQVGIATGIPRGAFLLARRATPWPAGCTHLVSSDYLVR